MQKWIGIGNLTREPELVQGTQNPLCRLNIAVNDNYIDKDGNRAVEFINVIAWNKLAENCVKYLHKGNKISVVGKIKTRKWQTDDGATKYAVEVMAQEIEFLRIQKHEGDMEEKQVVVDDDNLPF